MKDYYFPIRCLLLCFILLFFTFWETKILVSMSVWSCNFSRCWISFIQHFRVFVSINSKPLFDSNIIPLSPPAQTYDASVSESVKVYGVSFLFWIPLSFLWCLGRRLSREEQWGNKTLGIVCLFPLIGHNCFPGCLCTLNNHIVSVIAWWWVASPNFSTGCWNDRLWAGIIL